MGQPWVRTPVPAVVPPPGEGSPVPAQLQELSLEDTAASEPVNPVLNLFNPKEPEFW